MKKSSRVWYLVVNYFDEEKFIKYAKSNIADLFASHIVNKNNFYSPKIIKITNNNVIRVDDENGQYIDI